jgi:hypothetical protein
MGDSLSWNNMDDRERQGLIDSVRKQADDSGTFVNISGDTMTGTLGVPGFVATGTASLSAVRVTNQILGSTMNLSGAATLTGITQFTGEMRGATMNLSGAATLTGPTQFTNELRSTTLVNSGNATITGSLNIATKAVIAANASGTNPLTVQHVSTVIGGPTIAPIVVIASAASQAFLDFRGAVISTASLALTGANIAGLVRVWFQGSAGNAAGWLPIFTDAIAK